MLPINGLNRGIISLMRHGRNGFTLIEILLVVAAIAILAGIVIVAINPNKQLAQTRNAQRRADVNTILNAVYQYTIDNNGLPNIPTEDEDICQTGAGDCANFVDLSVLTVDEKYLPAIPTDPVAQGDDTGYAIHQTPNGRVVVSAFNAELGEVISVTR